MLILHSLVCLVCNSIFLAGYITSSNTEIDTKLDKNLIRVQSVVPTDPVEGMIWFSTDSASPIISVYKSGAWIKYGAVWK